MDAHKDLDKLRYQIDQIDHEIFELISKRQQFSSLIGKKKRSLGILDKDFKREKECFERSLDQARRLKISTQFAMRLQQLLMEGSLRLQEKDRIKVAHFHGQKKISVIGGAGRLGSWLCRFFADSGHHICVIDPIKPSFECSYNKEITEELLKDDFVVIATSIRQCAAILENFLKYSPKKTIIFDVASVKTPIKDALYRLKEAGFLVTSLHPMFGPSTEILFGKHIIRTSLGIEEADTAAFELFKHTSLKLVDMGLMEHDEVIAYLLSLSHMINLAFIATLKKSDVPLEELQKFSSPTFSKQMEITLGVCMENPHLYYEIQALNPKSLDILGQLRAELSILIEQIKNEDEASFVKFMAQACNYYEGKI